MKSKKPILFGGSIVLLGALGVSGMSDKKTCSESHKFRLGPIRTVSGEVVHIDEDSYTSWGTGAGSSVVFENLRVKEGDKVYKLIHLGPSSYKVGDKVEGLEYGRLRERGISIKHLNDLLTSAHTRSQTGYVEADGLITKYLPRHLRNYLFPR